jgi:hypothetical protein
VNQKGFFSRKRAGGAVGFSINGKGYVGTGEFGYTSLKDLWEYDPVIDQWTQLEDFPGGERRYAAGFSIGDKGYVGTGWSINGDNLNDFWEFTPPGCAAPGNLKATNISPQSAKLKWDPAVGVATKYKMQYRADSTGAAWISKTLKASNTPLTITGLQPNTPYKWKVRSICGEWSSAYSPPEAFTTSLRIGESVAALSFISAYPNPFTISSTISFSLKEDSRITIELFDLTGRKVQTVLDGAFEAGQHKARLNGELLNQGVYLLKASTPDEISIIPLVAE